MTSPTSFAGLGCPDWDLARQLALKSKSYVLEVVADEHDEVFDMLLFK